MCSVCTGVNDVERCRGVITDGMFQLVTARLTKNTVYIMTVVQVTSLVFTIKHNYKSNLESVITVQILMK